ncbi:MAG: alanine--glyoxylate aminotransferase family protein [Verrucomicrobiae bacterium]|nr:alanine--glyoxylate aminotransferase family protein [Verrucomicrobiae bacterium]MDW8343140.1 alanine--glyoxylate aminotransferase family protein [Verrucomicrobiae bacterium]
MTQPHVKLQIPGPVEVSPETFAAMCQPMIGHRGSGFQALYADIQPKLQQVLHTRQPVFLSTSSAWGVMEAAIRNLVAKKVLCCCCGAFSDKWFDVAQRCGKAAEALKVEWGQPILPEQVEQRLKTGEFDAITVVHNETSTGLMNPLAEIAAVVRRFPEVSFIVDTVSSMTAVKVEPDALGIDVMLAGVQKAWALPPGLTVFTVSERALQKAATIPGRGYYFDFLEFKANHDKNMTPSTPSIPHIYGLQFKLNQMLAEGMDNRYARHQRMAQMVRDWARRNGFELFPRAGYESVTLTCVKNNRQIDVAKFQKLLKERHNILIDGGYGAIKGKSFRIAHMGDETPATIADLLPRLDDCLQRL